MRSVFAIIEDLASGVSELRAALKPLSALAAGAHDARPAPRPRAARKTVRQRQTPQMKAVSPKLRAQRVVQGKYMAALRSLTAPQKAQVKKAKADGGYKPALKLAASFR